MLLNLEDFKNSEIQKVVYNINQLYDKEKIKKLKTVTAGLKQFIEDKNSEECKEAIFIISVLIEEIPDIMSDEIKDQLNKLIKSEITETRMNAIILYGKLFLEKMESEDSEQQDSITGDQIDEFIELLRDEVLEIKGNVVFFIEQFPEEYYDYILPKLNLFMNLLGKTEDMEVVEAVFYILGKVWQKTLPIKLSIFNTLKNIYVATSDKDKLLKILSFMREGSYELDGLLKSNENIKKDEIIAKINERGPLIKIYDIEMVAKTSNMSYKDVLTNFEKIKGDDKIFRFLFTSKKKFFVEIEIHPLVLKLQKNKIKVDDLIHIFGETGLDLISLLNLLIKKLVKSKFIKVYLSKSYFYSYDFIKKTMIAEIRKNGFVNIDEHAKHINYKFILSIAEDINRETKHTGIFNKERSLFLMLSGIVKKIENVCTKRNTFDLSEYWELYNKNDYKLIEDRCRQLFTKYHSGMIWLTPIGFTNTTHKFREGQIIGYVDLSKITEEQDIPYEITREILDEWLEDKSGLWDKSNTRFYFTKYLKNRLKKLDKTLSDSEKDKMISEFASELNLEKNLIEKKLNQEIEEIIQKIKTKPSIDINAYCRSLDMKREQFISFVNGLNIEYLMIQNEMIFDPNRIGKKKKDLEKEIMSKIRHDNLFVPDLSKFLKLSERMVKKAILKFHEEGKIIGILINNDLFLSESGIRRRFIDNQDYISMETAFTERTLEEEEAKLAISILENLINKGELIGDYNESNNEFHSEEAMVIQSMDDDKVNAEEMFETYKRYMKDTYEKVRDIYLNKKDIKLGDLKRKDFLIKRIMDEIQNWELHLNKAIKIAEKSFDSLDDAGDLTFGEVLDAEEVSDKIDGEFIMSEFSKWRQIVIDIEQNIDRVGALKKKLKEKPDDEELKSDLEELFEKLHFYDGNI